jgi:N-methylhydantoinase B
MAGGKEGENCHVILRPRTEREQVTGMVYESMATGEILANCSGGGGGWGDAYTHDPERVLDDVRNGYVTLASARRDYGVVINPDTMMVDTAATATLRGGRL